MKYLVCTADDSAYKKYDDIVLLHEGSLTYHQRIELQKQGKSIEILPDIFFDSKESVQQIEYIYHLFDTVMNHITDYLNELHHESHSMRFWNLALGRYIFNAINLYYVRYLELRQASEIISKAKIHIDLKISREERAWPISYEAYIQSDQCMARFYTDLLRDMNWGFEFSIAEDILSEGSTLPLPERFFDDIGDKPIDSLRRIKRNLVEKYYDSGSSTKIIVYAPYVINRGALRKLFFCSRKTMGMWNGRNSDILYNVCEPLLNYKLDERKKISFQNTDDSFLNFLLDHIVDFVPVTFIEGYESVKFQLKDYLSCSCKSVVSAGQYFYNNVFNLWSALMDEKGANIFAYQHGGRYGQNVITQLHEVITYKRFYLWGKNTPKEIYHSGIAVKLMGRKNWKYKKEYSNVILFCLSEKHRYMMNAVDGCGMNKSEYVKDELIFVDSIDKNKWMLLLRQFMFDKGCETLSDYKSEITDVIWQDSNQVGIDDAFSSCSLVVCDTFDTVALESFGLNHPTIVVDGFKNILLYDDFIECLNKLKRVGLYFENAEEAATYINNIDDIYDWWMKPDRRDAVMEFQNKYVNIPKRWKEEYVKLFL